MIDKRHIYDVTQSKTNHTCKNVLRNWTINWNLWLSHKLVKYPMTNLKRNWYVNWIKIECNHNGQFDIHYWTNFAKYDLENYETLHRNCRRNARMKHEFTSNNNLSHRILNESCPKCLNVKTAFISNQAMS